MKRVLLLFVVAVLALPSFGQGMSHGVKLRERWLGKAAPEFVVEKWLTKEPKMKGKFLLVDFWGPTCSPCRKMIPELNEWSKRFKKDMVLVGVAPNKEEHVRKMKEPVLEYPNAIDTKNRMGKTYGLNFYPMVVLIDPSGIVQWIGYPSSEELTPEMIEQFIKDYKKKR